MRHTFPFQAVLFLLFLPLLPVSAQEWVQKAQDPSVPFSEVQKSFEDYWEGETGPGWKQFKRWEWFVEPRSRNERRMPRRARWEAWKEEASKRSRSSKGDWQYIGNDDIPMYGGAGRVNHVAVHPDDPMTIYAGSASGGLWRSRDGGDTWEGMTDHIPVLGVSKVLIHPENPDTIYLATGDGNALTTYSIGILRSTDGGNNWSVIGPSFAQEDQYLVNDLIMNSEDPSTLLMSTSTGIYKSLNGGTDWYEVASGHYKDLEYHPTDSSIVYAGAFAFGGTSIGFVRSTDGGENFSTVSNGTPASGDAVRIEIAVSKDDPDRVYFVAGDASTDGMEGFYRSDDAGQSFTQQAIPENLLAYDADGSGSGGQAWYDLAIAAHPQNADYVYVGGINIWRSTNGGADFEIRTHWWGDQNLATVHADIHHLHIDGNGRLWVGNDGGVFQSPDLGNTWDDYSDGLEIAQIYRIGQDAQDPEQVLSGWQDNGTNHRTSGNSWYRVIGGDGMECIIDHSNPSVMYGSLYYGRIYKSDDGGNSFDPVVNSNGSGVDEEGAWVTPYVMEPFFSDRLLVGKKEVYRSTDGANSWSSISNLGLSDNLQALAVAESDPDHIYTATSTALWKRDGSSSNFSSRDADLPLSQTSVTYIAVHRQDPDKAWVSLSGFEDQEKLYYTDDGGLNWENRSQGLPNVPANCVVHEPSSPERVYVGTDLGVYYRDSTMAQFEPFNNGLPNVIVNELAVHEGADKLRAATYGRGLWESDLLEVSSLRSENERIGLQLHPNPTDGRVRGRIPGAHFSPEAVPVRVLDASGRTVKEFRIEPRNGEFAFDLSGLEQGLYFLRFELSGRERTEKVMLK